MDQSVTPIEPPKGTVDARTSDLTIVRVLLRDLIAGVEGGPKSRGRSLLVTKLQEAEMWAGYALFEEPSPGLPQPRVG